MTSRLVLMLEYLKKKNNVEPFSRTITPSIQGKRVRNALTFLH